MSGAAGELEERRRSIRTRADLVAFLEAFNASFTSDPAAWENRDLARFLDAMAGWAADMDGYYANVSEDVEKVPPWRVLADILMAARSYE